MAAELRFPAMGTDVHLVIVGGAPSLPTVARDRVEQLERRWSRFRADSEISRLNGAAGASTPVSPETRVLVRCGVLGWRRTDGWFDPTVHDALVAAGYDRDLQLVTRRPRIAPDPTGPAPGCAGVVVDDGAGTVTLPAGVRFDPGGIGKGLAADLVAEELLAAGAAGVCVNIGGDLRAAGEPPDGPAWCVAVPDHDDESSGMLHLLCGGVATSSTQTRRWPVGDALHHHLIDPGTGRPGGHQEVVTVVAATGWEAEVAAKAALLAPRPEVDRLLDGLAAGALLVGGASTETWHAMDRFLDRRPLHEVPA